MTPPLHLVPRWDFGKTANFRHDPGPQRSSEHMKVVVARKEWLGSKSELKTGRLVYGNPRGFNDIF